jgi:hypothetical protein
VTSAARDQPNECILRIHTAFTESGGLRLAAWVKDDEAAACHKFLRLRCALLGVSLACTRILVGGEQSTAERARVFSFCCFLQEDWNGGQARRPRGRNQRRDEEKQPACHYYAAKMCKYSSLTFKSFYCSFEEKLYMFMFLIAKHRNR